MKQTEMSVLAVIPARWASKRFPGKPLALIAGKPMVQWVWEKAQTARLVTDVVIATDDKRIANVVAEFGARAEMTSPSLPSGTDRVAKVAMNFPEYQVILNVQGDEPLISPDVLDAVAQPLIENSDLPIATAVTRITDAEDYENENVVKVVLGHARNALYFSRAAIPFYKNGFSSREKQTMASPLRHLGIYGYQREVLLKLAQLKPSPLEQAEALEQLRFLEAGFTIHCAEVESSGPGVDRPEDIPKVEALLETG